MASNMQVKREDQVQNESTNMKYTKLNPPFGSNMVQVQQVKIQNIKNTATTPAQINVEIQSNFSTKIIKRSKKVSTPMQQPKKQQYIQIKWFCPCGEKMLGPFNFFQHIKAKHEADFLEKVIRKETIKTFIRNYPQNSPLDYEMIQSLDEFNIETQVIRISQKYKQSDFTCEDTVPMPQHRGTYADLARKFFQEFGKNLIEQLFLSQFFMFLQHFIQRRYGKDYWEQQSPKDIIKMSNHLFHYFRAVIRLSKNEFGPLKAEDIKKMIYMLAKWMFINKWTNDRLVNIESQQDTQLVADKIMSKVDVPLQQTNNHQSILNATQIVSEPLTLA